MIKPFQNDKNNQHDKTTAKLLNLVGFMPNAENRQNVSIFRMSTNMPFQTDKTTADLVNFMPYARYELNLSIFRMSTNMLL